MNINVSRLIMLNQMAGPLFRELAEDLAPLYREGCILITGHPDTVNKKNHNHPKLSIESAPEYNRSSNLKRVLSWFRYIFYVSKILFKAKKGDVILFVSNPPILGGWVWLLTRLRKIPYAVLVYDIHPDVLIRLGVLKENGFIVSIWRFINRLVYKNSSLVVTIGNRMAHNLKSQLPARKKDVYTIKPWVDVKEIKPLSISENPHAHRFIHTNDKYVVLYSGNMGASHDIDSMLEASMILRHHSDIKFLFIGEGEKFHDIRQFISKHKLTNISLFPFQPEFLVKYTMPLADISLVSLDQGMEDLMVPSKTFYYLAAGSALVAIANDQSELSDLLDQRLCGKLVPPGNPELLASTIQNIVSNPDQLAKMKKNSRDLARSNYSREVSTTKFSRLLIRHELL